jgi:hypothetical protein
MRRAKRRDCRDGAVGIMIPVIRRETRGTLPSSAPEFDAIWLKPMILQRA